MGFSHCLMLTCESTPKNKKSGCPSNKAVIAKRMKERMSEGGGDRKREEKKIGYDQMDNPDFRPTTKRAELAKIARTSQGSIQRTKLILEKDDKHPIFFHSSSKTPIYTDNQLKLA